jgi:hypothetical protein
MLHFVRFTACTLAAASLVATSIGAQGSTAPLSNNPVIPPAATLLPAAQAVPVAVTLSLAPRADAVSAGVRAKVMRPEPAPAPGAGRGDTARNKALMIVGGAALLVGAIIGNDAGTIIMVGGAVVGLYGLYKFLE